MSREYPEPFIPATFSCWVTKTSTQVTTRDRRTGKPVTKAADRWDVRGRANGVLWTKRFARAGLAETWRDRLNRGYAAGLRFDLSAKRFVEATSSAPDAPTVFSITEAFYWAHPEWEPKTKILAATAFNRARRWLLAPGAILEGGDLTAVVDYLDNASFLPSRRRGELTPRQLAGLSWLQAHSAPADRLTTGELEDFVARFERNQRNPSKRVSATTIVRYTQPLRACWAWAAARDDIAVSRDPWPAVKVRRKIKGKTAKSGTTRTALAVDADLVLDIPQACALAAACAHDGSWGGSVICYVLVMAMCGLRPNEAVGLLWDDIELPPDNSSGWLSVRRTRRKVASRWLDPEEDPEWGPLKDRDLAETRRVPIHPLLVGLLRTHEKMFGHGPDGLVFHRRGKPFDLSMFARDVWEPGRRRVFPPRSDLAPDSPRQPKVSRLRRHDLRHAACSWWLRSGVDATVCQRWSGHRTLSVFLDVYQGVAPGREDEGVRALVASLPG